ncbi:MAG: bifunctional riboflavin kinase/FAD synthetase [Syntrophomonadaceae bacterium]|nr:bifunctional riboflavin kinase/FAD synthetase [Syntrophomonadaceae bacterium]
MQIVRGIENFQKTDEPLYLALGNFDGVHLGHKKLISEMVDKARFGKGVTAALIFAPHPSQVLNPDNAPKLLVTAERKAELLQELGLDILIYTPFTLELSKWSPETFVERIVVNKLHTKEVFVGFNYTFGNKGLGTPELLSKLGEKYGFGVNIIPPVKINGETVSSSLIRCALDIGDIQRAYNMLGYYPMLEGIVVKGEQRGSVIGFPTANLEVSPDLNVPGKGVYAAIAVIGSERYKCVVNIGSKPTFHDNYPLSVEAHLLDYKGDLYNRHLQLYFLERIRGEKRFSSAEELAQQIELDCKQAEIAVSHKY